MSRSRARGMPVGALLLVLLLVCELFVPLVVFDELLDVALPLAREYTRSMRALCRGDTRQNVIWSALQSLMLFEPLTDCVPFGHRNGMMPVPTGQ